MEEVSKYVTVLVKRCMFLDNMSVSVKFSLSVSWAYGGEAELQLRSFLTSVLVGGEWSTLCRNTQWTGG